MTDGAIIGFVIVANLIIVFTAIGVASGNGHPNAGGVSALALIGLVIPFAALAALIWAFVGGQPNRVPNSVHRIRLYAQEEDERTAQLLSGESNRVVGRNAFAGLPEFEIIGTKSNGERVRFKVNAEDADGAKFIAAERDVTVLGLRRVEETA